MLGVTWRWSPGEVGQLRNAFYYRNSDTTGLQGEAFPDLAGRNPTLATTPVRTNILRMTERETEMAGAAISARCSLGWNLLGRRAGRRRGLDFDRRLSGDWIRYVYDPSDFRPDRTQQFIVLTPEESTRR